MTLPSTFGFSAALAFLVPVSTAHAQCAAGDYSASNPATLTVADTLDGEAGTRIDVANSSLESENYGNRAFSTDNRLHTLGNSSLARANFCEWTRWYQEDGNTQIFRLFAGDENVQGDPPRELAARSEAFTPSNFGYNYDAANPRFRQWTGRYRIRKPQDGSIFQSKHSGSDAWSVQLQMEPNGDVYVEKRRAGRTKIGTAMNGKSFDVAVLDNGLSYKVYYREGSSSTPLGAGNLVASGTWTRNGSGANQFRWGTYIGAQESEGSEVYVSGARYKTLAAGASSPDE
jgi:hypothetical protein